MDNRFFEHPILNSPYDYPSRHWKLDDQGQPTQQIIECRRRAKFITPIPNPRKRKGKAQQQPLFVEKDISTADKKYAPIRPGGETRSVKCTYSLARDYTYDNQHVYKSAFFYTC